MLAVLGKLRDFWRKWALATAASAYLYSYGNGVALISTLGNHNLPLSIMRIQVANIMTTIYRHRHMPVLRRSKLFFRRDEGKGRALTHSQTKDTVFMSVEGRNLTLRQTTIRGPGGQPRSHRACTGRGHDPEDNRFHTPKSLNCTLDRSQGKNRS